MWARARFDLSKRDIGYGLARCARSPDREALRDELETLWAPETNDTIACFSVRSGFDLLLQSLGLEEGSEILFSALNIRGMVKIARRLGHVPIPIDLELDTMRPSLESIERAITPRSKVIVVAPLFGTRFDIEPIVRLARRHGLFVVEDCAQAFCGLDFNGHESADVSMFSFGPLKFATALGGALLRVRDPDLLARMRAIEAGYPIQPTREYAGRLTKFGGLTLLTTRPVLGAVSKFFSARGKDYEDAVTDKVRGVAKLGSAKKIRRQCPAALLALMKRRITRFTDARLEPRRELGRLLLERLNGVVTCPGSANDIHNFWVFPILVDRPHDVMMGLRRHGFDAATLRRSTAIEPPEDRPELAPTNARSALKRLIVLPCYPGMPISALARQSSVIEEIVAESPAAPPAAAATAEGASDLSS